MERAALGWGVSDLATAAKVAQDTISRLDRGDQLREGTADAIQRTLEEAGVEFLPDNGVRLKRQPAPADKPGGGGPAASEKSPSPGETAAPRARKPRASDSETKPAPQLSKEAQVRALREQST